MDSMTITAEKVSQTREVNKGSHIEYATDTFWIAYPTHVAGYGHQSDRISHATGQGRLRREALAQARGLSGKPSETTLAWERSYSAMRCYDGGGDLA